MHKLAQTGTNLLTPAQTSFQVLLKEDEKREQVRRIVYEAFGQYLVVDPTNLGQLNLRLSARAPNDNMQARGLHDQALAFHISAKRVMA